MNEDWHDGGFGLYLHWPFCQSKCPYCDFNSHVATQIDQNRWAAAFEQELTRAAAETPGRLLNTIYFGGGTPSLMEPFLVARILDRVRGLWPLANDLEVTLEANPGSVEAGRFRDYAGAGVSRVSLGLQAMNDADLRRLGRMHSAAEGRRALDIARSTFARVTFDLIYARQDQSLDDWRAELTDALSLGADHMSLYQLTIEDGTVFAARYAAGHLHGLPDEDRAADMFELTQDLMEDAGLPAYEVSNHAGPGQGSRHNLVYWRAGDYLGIGPGAHGRLTLNGQFCATEGLRAPGAWLEAVEKHGSGEVPRQSLTSSERATEYLLNAMRLSEGLSLSRFARLSGQPLRDDVIADLQDQGILRRSGDRISTTRAGRMVLNLALRALVV